MKPVRILLAAGVFFATAVAAEESASSAVREVRYVALGDSFTEGTGSKPQQAFPFRLAERWRARGPQVSVRNLAKNGYATREVIEWEIPKVREFAPSIVTLAVGANDIVRSVSAEEYRRQLQKIFWMLRAEGVPASRIIVLPQPQWSLSPAAESFGDARLLSDRIAQFNGILGDEAKAAGARFLDLYPLMQSQAREGRVAADGLHPSADAYDAWAEAIVAKIPAANLIP
jgi:acyl-CoA thioesterase I